MKHFRTIKTVGRQTTIVLDDFDGINIKIIKIVVVVITPQGGYKYHFLLLRCLFLFLDYPTNLATNLATYNMASVIRDHSVLTKRLHFVYAQLLSFTPSLLTPSLLTPSLLLIK